MPVVASKSSTNISDSSSDNGDENSHDKDNKQTGGVVGVEGTLLV